MTFHCLCVQMSILLWWKRKQNPDRMIHFFHKCWFPRANKNHQPCSWHPQIPPPPEDETFVCSFPKKLMITRVHGTKRGGTHIYGDQTRWQTGPSGNLPPTRKKNLLTHTHTQRVCGTASQLKQHLIWGDGNRRTQACNPVRVTPACLKWVPVAIGPWLRGIGKWICLQSNEHVELSNRVAVAAVHLWGVLGFMRQWSEKVLY